MASTAFALRPLLSGSGSVGSTAAIPPLVTAVRAGDFAAVNSLIAAGADLEAKDSAGLTALAAVFDATVYMAASTTRYKVFKALLTAGADPNTTDRFGTTPLMLCLWRIYGASNTDPYRIVHDPRYTKRLLRAGADPNAAQHGETIFYMALKHGKYQEAAYILQAGANPLIGETGGIDAIGDGIFVREELVDLILENTADGAARLEYIAAGRELLRSLLLILDGRPHMSVFAINTWPRRNFIADYTAERLIALHGRFTLEDRMPLLLLWESAPWRQYIRALAAQEGEA